MSVGLPPGSMSPPSQSLSLSGSPCPTTPRRKNREMCQQCRHDKQRCEPQTRDWEVLQEKCKRCHDLGHPCGPSERAEKKARRKRIPTNSPISNQLSEPPHLRSPIYLERNDNLRSFPNGTQRLRSDHGVRPMDPWTIMSSARSSSPARSPLLQAQASNVVVWNCPVLQGRKLLVKLEDILAVINLFSLELQHLRDIAFWINETVHTASPQNIIQSVIHGLKAIATKCIQTADKFLDCDLGSAEELFLQHLCSAKEKYDRIRSTPYPVPKVRKSGAVSGFSITARSRRSLYNVQRKTGVCSTLYYLCGEICDILAVGPCMHQEADPELVEAYSTASQAITDVLSKITFGDVRVRNMVLGQHLNHRPMEGSKLPLPTCHLAARQTNSAVLLELWQRCNCAWELDFLRRTAVHVAAYAGNLSVLEPIFEDHPGAATGIDPDIFGLTPPMIAACKDDVEGLNILLTHGADDTILHNGRNLLALAARNGSHKVVRYLLAESDRLPFSVVPELSEAILAGQKDVAHIFVEHYRNQTIDTDNTLQIQAGIEAARAMGYHELADELQIITPRPPVLSNAIAVNRDLDYDAHYLVNGVEAHSFGDFNDNQSFRSSQDLHHHPTNHWSLSQNETPSWSFSPQATQHYPSSPSYAWQNQTTANLLR